MQLRYRFFMDLLHEHSPALSFHLTAQGVTPDLYLLEWCMTLFCKRLKLDVVGRVWDLYILEGEVAVYRVGVGLLMAMNEGGRMLKEDMGEVLKRLSQGGAGHGGGAPDGRGAQGAGQREDEAATAAASSRCTVKEEEVPI